MNKCVKSNQCFNNSDCEIFDSGYHSCCRKGHTPKRHGCRINCVGESCSTDSDCGGSGECCRNKKCTTSTLSCQSSKDFNLALLVGVIGAISLIVAVSVFVYRRGRAAGRETRRVQMTTHNNTEMMPLQNTQVQSTNQQQDTDSHNLQQGMLTSDTQTNNEEETVEFLDSHVESRNEIDRAAMPNTPPPPYSVTRQTVLSELDQDLPPSYTQF